MVELIKKHLIGIIVAIIVSLSIGFQIWQVYNFMHQGKRFTAKDGQELCERLAVLERHSVLFKESNFILRPCSYYEGH